MPPRPPAQYFFIFHAVFGKNWPNNRLTFPSGWRPPLGNPGSATEFWADDTDDFVAEKMTVCSKSAKSDASFQSLTR